MSMSPGTPVDIGWRVIPKTDLRWRLLEGQYVVYNSGSGDTHVLDPIAALLIQQLTGRCYKSKELAEQIGMLLNIEVTEELHTKLQQTLWQLDEKRLIEPATS